MTEKAKENVVIAKWAARISITLMLALGGLAVNAIIAYSTVKERQEINRVDINENTFDIKTLEKEKADKETIDRVYDILDRIEKKLDDHIAITDN